MAGEKTKRSGNKGGRPVTWTEKRKAKAIKAILAEIASGRPLTSVCTSPELPGYVTWYEWMKADEQLVKEYARACSDRADVIFEKLGDLSNDVKDGKIEPNAARVAADIEKWRLGKMKPKVYGDRAQLDHGVGEGQIPGLSQPLRIEFVNPGETGIHEDEG